MSSYNVRIIFPIILIERIVTSIYFFYKAWIYHISHLFFNFFYKKCYNIIKNIIASGPEKPEMDYHIHGADEVLLIPEMEEAVLIYYGSDQKSARYLTETLYF